jgi:hypothetical protein
MASTVYSGGYGLGTYGTSRYGAIAVTHTPDGVYANIVSDSGVNIIGDARHVVVSLVSPAIEGSVGVIAVANVGVTGFSVTTTLNPTLSFILDAILLVDGSSVGVSLGDVVVSASSNYQITTGNAVSVDSNLNLVVTADAVTEAGGQSVDVLFNAAVELLLDCVLETTGNESLVQHGDVVVTAESVAQLEFIEQVFARASSVSVFADSNTIPVGLQLSVDVGIVTTRTENRIDVFGNDITSYVNDGVNVIGVSNYTLVGNRSITVITPAIVVADSNYAITTGNEISSFLGDIAVSDNARPTFDSLSGFVSVSSVEVSTTYFDYNAVADAYARFRTVIVNAGTTVGQRRVIVEQQSRTIAIARASTTNDRSAKVG